MYQTLLKYTPRTVKDSFKKFNRSKFKWRYITNLDGTLQQQFFPGRLSPEEQKILKQLNSQGIAVSNVDDLFPGKKVLEGLTEEYSRLEESHKNNINAARNSMSAGSKNKSFLYRFLEMDDSIDKKNLPDTYILKKIASSPEFERIASSYLNLKTKLVYFDFWLAMKTRMPPTRSQLWHRDIEDHMTMKIFIYLNDVDENTGPFCYVKGTHVKGEINRNPVWFKEPTSGNLRSKDTDVYQTYEIERIIPMTGKRGDIILADTRGLHKGGHARENDRKLLKIEYLARKTDLDSVYGVI